MRSCVLGLAALLCGCSSLDQFDIPLDASGTVAGQFSSIPGVSEGFEGLAGAGATVAQKIENQGVEAEDLASARLTVGTLSVTAPAGADLRWLSSFDLKVSAPGLDEKRIAYRDDFPAAQASYDLTLDDLDLKPYVAAASMTITPGFVRATKPAKDHKIAIHLVLHVDLSVIE